jgi:hypothetical protein
MQRYSVLMLLLMLILLLVLCCTQNKYAAVVANIKMGTLSIMIFACATSTYKLQMQLLRLLLPMQQQ